ncbi:outer membrane protein [uncultured Methylobacterium sp.]|uniref:outer membrane protein n=1 Tax=uncultured Methylobacterium sp. TaxID=157278 RepID=UPI0035CB5980
MKKLLASLAAFTALTAAASAADLPRRAPPPVFTPVPVFTWTGFYFGINAGYAFDAGEDRKVYGLPAGSVVGSPDTNVLIATTNQGQSDGFSGGAQIGYNYQFTPGSGVVIGVEADAQYLDTGRRAIGTQNFTYTGNGGFAFAVPPRAGIVTRGNGLDYFGTVRGRIGYAFDRVLFYGTGGFAYGSGEQDQNFSSIGLGSRDEFRTGYAAGGGVEYALPTDSFLNFFRSSAVTLKVEGLYVSLDRSRNTVGGIYSGAQNLVYIAGGARETEFAVVRAGLNYKFGSY